MQLQVAMDRLSIEEAVRLAQSVQPYADWIEVGTSLIKEFGMESVRRMRAAVPDKRVVADIKTMDGGRYEFEICFEAGADAATVMAAAADATIGACVQTARERGRLAIIDLLATGPDRQQELLRYEDAIFGMHIGKDLQESGGKPASIASILPDWANRRQIAAAGGIRLEDIPALGERAPGMIVIAGSSITGAPDPAEAAREFARAMAPYRQTQKNRGGPDGGS